MTIYISQVGKPTFFATRFFSIAWSWIRFLTRLFRFVIGVISIVDNFDSLVWVQFGGDSRFVKYYFRDPNEIVFLGKNVPNVISARFYSIMSWLRYFRSWSSWRSEVEKSGFSSNIADIGLILKQMIRKTR